MESREQLIKKLENEIADARRKAKLNYRWAYGCYIAAFIGSVAAAVIAAFDSSNDYRLVTVIAALLPTVSLSALSTFKFSSRSDWHYMHLFELEAIQRHMLNDKKDLTELIDWWNTMERRVNRSWPKFGVLPGGADPQPKVDPPETH